MMGGSKKIDGGEGDGGAKQAEMEKKVSNNEDKRTILYIFVFIFVSGKKRAGYPVSADPLLTGSARLKYRHELQFFRFSVFVRCRRSVSLWHESDE